MRLKGAALLLLFLFAGPARADYAVLRNGQRLHIFAYERTGSRVRLRLEGGWIEIAASELAALEPEEIFKLPAAAQEKIPYAQVIQAASRKYGVDEMLITSVIAVESNFDARAISRRNARGLMQLMPETAARMGVSDVFDPAQSIDGGTRYLKELLERYQQDLRLALAAYNAGPDRVERYGGVPPFAETAAYVHRVRQDYDRRKKSSREAGKTVPPRTPAPASRGSAGRRQASR